MSKAKFYPHPTKNLSMLECRGMGFALTNAELKKAGKRYNKLKKKEK